MAVDRAVVKQLVNRLWSGGTGDQVRVIGDLFGIDTDLLEEYVDDMEEGDLEQLADMLNDVENLDS